MYVIYIYIYIYIYIWSSKYLPLQPLYNQIIKYKWKYVANYLSILIIIPVADLGIDKRWGADFLQ